MLEIGSVIDGKYKILNKIGQGGMSVVYLAMNERANKQWAIKEVRKEGISDANFEVIKQGLVAEVDMLKKLNHPHLPSIIDVIDGDGSFLIVMDYIEGVSLNKKLKEAGPLSQDDVIKWGKQLCDVLGYLHSRKRPIIYRDMKPANVMLKPDGNVMLIDFGTAREFKAGSNADDTQCLGTRGYAAPEQYGGAGQTDARTDIFCLGATLYHLVTGHNPSEYPYEMYPIRQFNPTLSSGLESIILKCTRKNPDERYQSCAELLYALEHYQDFDIETIKKQNVRWRSFLSVTLASLIMFGGSIGFKIKDDKDIQWSYDTNLLHAVSYEDFPNLKTAAEIFPKRIDPYKKALDLISADSKFTTQEHTALISSLLDPSSDLIDRLKDGSDSYYKFCYDLAIAYFFYYENELSGIANCQRWFDEAAKSPVFTNQVDGEDYSMSDIEIRNAKTLKTLSAAVAGRIGKTTGQSLPSGTAVTDIGAEDSATGSVKYSEKDYWNDLVSITNLEFFSQANSVTKQRVYSWILTSMKTDFDKLINVYGIAKTDILAVKDRALVDLNSQLSGMSPSEDPESTYQRIQNLISQYEVVDNSWR